MPVLNGAISALSVPWGRAGTPSAQSWLRTGLASYFLAITVQSGNARMAIASTWPISILASEKSQEKQPQQQQQEQQSPIRSNRPVRLLTRTELPAWADVDANPFILSGYRPETRSWAHCLASWTYWHNETGNIYSHLVPGVLLLLSILNVRIDLPGIDGAILTLQLATAVLCLFVSTLYHTALNHSAHVAHLCLQLDYVGILVLILGNFISGLHFGFYCDPTLKLWYWSLIVAFSAATGLVLLSPRFRGPEWRTLRLASFIGTGLSAFAPIGHAWYLWGRAHLMRVGVPYYLLEGALLLVGCYVWEKRVPECLYPGRFDIWGHSHTLWHVFVALSIAAHVGGLFSALDYNLRHAPCRMQ